MLHRQFPSLDPTALAKIFPLFNPFTIDLIVFWQLPQTNRTGWHYLPDLEATRGPNVVIDLLEKAAATFGGGRYEESAQERLKLIEQIHTSDLARSDCPVAVTCQDTNSKRSSARSVCHCPQQLPVVTYH